MFVLRGRGVEDFVEGGGEEREEGRVRSDLYTIVNNSLLNAFTQGRWWTEMERDVSAIRGRNTLLSLLRFSL